MSFLFFSYKSNEAYFSSSSASTSVIFIFRLSINALNSSSLSNLLLKEIKNLMLPSAAIFDSLLTISFSNESLFIIDIGLEVNTSIFSVLKSSISLLSIINE